MQCTIDLVSKAKQQSLYKARRAGRAEEDDDDPFEYLDPVALEALSALENEAMAMRAVRYELEGIRLILDQVRVHVCVKGRPVTLGVGCMGVGCMCV